MNTQKTLGSVTLRELQEVAVVRSDRWHNGKRWSPSDWMTAIVGELGEAANCIKKMNRIRDGMQQSHVTDRGITETDLLHKIARELADVQCYLPLLANELGIDLEAATVNVFNKISEELGAPERL